MTVARRRGAIAASPPTRQRAADEPTPHDHALALLTSQATEAPRDEPLPLGRRPYRELLQALGVAVYVYWDAYVQQCAMAK